MQKLMIDNLNVNFGGLYSLQVEKLSLNESGEILAILGRNGAGKTTLLNAILDLIPHNGSVKIFGIKNNETSGLWKEKTGIFIDDSFLIDYFYPEEYFELISSFIKDNLFDLDEFYNEFSDFFANEILREKKLIKSFSKGNKAKIGIAGALLHHPRLIILDEPSAHLDNSSKQQLIKILLRRKEMEHASVLFATHDLDMVMDIADRIVILKDGQLALNLAVADIDKETIINLLLT